MRRSLPASLVLALSAAISAALAPACSRGDAIPSTESSPSVVVTIAPLAGLVEPMLGKGERIGIVIPPGRTIHAYEPRAADRAMLERADLVVCVGLGLEGPLDPILGSIERRGKLIRFADVAGIAQGEPDEHDHASHADDAHEHHDNAVDPHLWLDPLLCVKLIDAVYEQLAKRAPSDTERDRLATARRDLHTLCAQIASEYAAALAPYRGASLVTHHAAWSRLLDPHGIEVAAVIRPIEGAEPTPGELAASRRAIEREGAVGVIVEPQFDAAWPRRIAEDSGVPIGVLDPIGDGGWSAMMRTNLAELVRILAAAAERSSTPTPQP